jgi:S1-C subfamily serine protease
MTDCHAVALGLIVSFGAVRLGAACHQDCPGQSPQPAAAETREPDASPITKDEAEKRAKDTAARVGQAFVKVEHTNGQHLGGEAAIIVSADGHVVYRSITRGVKKTFVLADGRRAVGTHLGGSDEWGVGLAKLDGPGPWPHVELSRSDAGTKAGQWVVSLGYPRNEPAEAPLVAVAPVRGSATGRWFVLDDGKLTIERNTPAVFDLDGRLVGVGFDPYLGGDLGTVYTDANVIRALWDDLAAGENLDELRLRDAGRPGGGDRPAPALTPEVEARAKAASVRIRLGAKEHGWSGTIVSADGVVLTCAHGLDFVTAGTKVIVGLPDGRDAVGEITGYNHVCDICVVKITDKGPWPHVEVGRSTRLRAGDACLMIGYGPVEDTDRQPRVRRTTAEQWHSLWTHEFDVDPSLETVGGDSGGGIFDADGRLVACWVGERGPTKPGQYGKRVELFEVHHDEMAGPYEQAAPIGPHGDKSEPGS